MTTHVSRRSALALLGLIAVATLPTLAATFTLDQVLSSPFPTGLVAASQGTRIAWVFNSQGARNVWVADGPNFAARQVTHYSGDDGNPIASLRLTPDGRTIVFVRGSETKEAGRVATPTNHLSPRKQMVWAQEVDGEGAPSTRILLPRPNTCRLCPRWTRKRSGCGAVPTVAT